MQESTNGRAVYQKGPLMSTMLDNDLLAGLDGRISGSVLGAIILTAAPELMRDPLGNLARRHVLPPSVSPDLIRQLLYALLLIVLMLTRPQGIFGQREVSLRGLFSRRRLKIGAPLTKA